MRRVAAASLALAVAWTVLLIVAAARLPVYAGLTSTRSVDGRERTQTTSATLLETHGLVVLAVLAAVSAAVMLTVVLVLLSRHHVWATWAGWVPVGAVGLLSLAGLLTIGVFLLPLIALLGVAVLAAMLDRHLASAGTAP
ncbi:hypothetical protein [Nocardioides acrostichi]|uniref:Uncharacterized protein n=1 Tax=Nocardioides acrostichi TaxID=2784339 RepID=A0A930UWK7_9ACTN|nr:hypothetical protein [Nocardioides acrostichi]MBF4160405.1 hypothetical protein [Nocardioides acrostichi]